jgi:cell division cycle 14
MLCGVAFEVFVSSSDRHKVQVLISQDGAKPDEAFLSFRNDEYVQYHPYCDDFGPMNLSSTIHFIKLLDAKISECAAQGIGMLVYSVDSGRRPLSNGVMLLGAYMILMQDQTPNQVAVRFGWIGKEQVEDFRDATHLPGDFGLTLLDCWSGLHRGKQLAWIARPTCLDCPFWGEIDMEQYEHYDDPLEADLVEVVPLKLIAFRGPRDLGGAKYVDNEARWSRRFGPEHFAEALQDLGVSDVVRLNAPEYDAGVFAAAGIRHHDLFFEDCTEPPPDVVAAFFRIVDGAEGVVAVHCLAGLGRTGSLAALHMMRSHGFTAREAMGWLRIMRPGSVIGEQQQFLCTVERWMASRVGRSGAWSPRRGLGACESLPAAAGPGLARSASVPGGGTGLAGAAAGESRSREQAAQVAGAMWAQSAARARAGRDAGAWRSASLL